MQSIEAEKSLLWHQAGQDRRLKHHHEHHHEHHREHHGKDEQNEMVLKHNGRKKPKVKPKHGTSHGMMIDAGSQGTRIHVYEFEARILSTRKQIKHAAQGRKLTFPTTDTRWTDRLRPGLDHFAFVEDDEEMRKQIKQYLSPLIDFARWILIAKHDHYKDFPIYLKATGGLRTLAVPYRLRLIETVRSLFRDKSFNPFFFENEHARVISGEEEAIYGWTAVNFVKGTLIRNSEGTGSVLKPGRTYGMLEMGGASTQIGFFEPNGDVMANLFKLQIGAAKHWNVYAHSFLYFGVEAAFARLNARLYTEASLAPTTNATGIYNPCLPGGSQFNFSSRVHMLKDGTLLPYSSEKDASKLVAKMYSAIMINEDPKGDFDQCAASVEKLLRKDANSWCSFAHDRDCSFAGIYQPPLPIEEVEFSEFIATSNFYHVWDFIGLKEHSSVDQVHQGARKICTMSIDELHEYNNQRATPLNDNDVLQYCFRATFVAKLLSDGFGFPAHYNITAVDVIEGRKVGWALGSMLYEINTLPWGFKGKLLHNLAPKWMLAMFAAKDDNEFDFDSMFAGMLFIVVVAGMVGGVTLFRSHRRQASNSDMTATETLALTGSSGSRQTDYGARRFIQ